jgi:hypothetical protein
VSPRERLTRAVLLYHDVSREDEEQGLNLLALRPGVDD